MKKSSFNTSKYHFKSTSSIDGTLKHYMNSKILRNAGQYKIYDSYTSNIIDLNKIKQQALAIHFHTINKAIKYAKRQIEQGVSEKMHIPLPELNKVYYHRVFTAAKKMLKLEQSNYTTKEIFEASQPYWIDQNAIVTYGFREDKDLSSKFQAFVEFPNAHRAHGNLKLNLQMSKQAFKHIDELYLDGFDLVQNVDKSYSVRHVKQSIVKKKESTGIDKLLFVDKWLNIYSIEIDKTAVDENGQPLYDENSKIVNGFIYKSHKTSTITKLLIKLTSKVSSKKYLEILHRFEMSLKARLSREIGSDNEDNITLLLPQYHHKTANNINSIVERIVKDLCHRRGLPCKKIEKSDIELNKIVEQYKKQCSKKSDYKFKTTHTKWQEYAYAFMSLKYSGFHLYLRNTRKSSAKTVRDIPQKDVEEFGFKELEQYIDIILANVVKHDGTTYMSKLLARYNDFVNEQTKQRRIAEGTYVPEPEFV